MTYVYWNSWCSQTWSCPHGKETNIHGIEFMVYQKNPWCRILQTTNEIAVLKRFSKFCSFEAQKFLNISVFSLQNFLISLYATTSISANYISSSSHLGYLPKNFWTQLPLRQLLTGYFPRIYQFWMVSVVLVIPCF